MKKSTHKTDSNFIDQAGNILHRLVLLLAVFAFTFIPPIVPIANAQLLKNLINPNTTIVIDKNKIQLKKTILCLVPFVSNAAGTKCVCPVGKTKVGNSCVFIIKPMPLPLACFFPFVPNATGTKCVCPAGKTKIGNSCVSIIKPLPLPLACFFPFVPNATGTKCVCPAGKIKVGNTCKQKIIPLPIICAAPFVPNFSGTKCVCPAGTKYKFGSCVPNVLILCTPPFIPNAANTKCQCPPGQVIFQNSCVYPSEPKPLPLPPTGPACKWPFVYSGNYDACVCSSGYRLNSTGTSCIRKAVSPPSVPRATIRQIQSCLAVLGYQPGPADGVSGRNTRNAWALFRQDEGLFNRPSKLSDPVIQDRLFQSCDKAQDIQSSIGDQSPGNDPVPSGNDPVPSGNDDDAVAAGVQIITNFDAKNGYPPLQCATPGLYETLKEALGSELDIGLCGQSCTPIPPGMSPSQIAATGNNVNWCLSCAKIGNELLCAANPPEEN